MLQVGAFAEVRHVTEEVTALGTDGERREGCGPPGNRLVGEVRAQDGERGRGRRLGLALGGFLVLALGWVAGSSTQLVDVTQTKGWFDQSATVASSAFVSVQNAVAKHWNSVNKRVFA